MRNWVLISRLIIGGYLAISGLIYANDVVGFSYQLEDFFQILDLGFLKSTKVSQAAFYSFLQLFLGGMMLFGLKPKSTILLTILMLIIQLIASSMIMFHSLKVESLPSLMNVAIEFTLLILCVLLFRKRTEIRSIASGKWNKVVIATNLIISAAIPCYSYNFLPVIDCSTFFLGVDLRHDGAQSTPSFKIFDIDKSDVTAEVLEYNGHQFLLVIEEIESCNFKLLPKFNVLAANAEKSGVPFYGLTSNEPSIIEDFRHEVQAAYPFLIADQQVLRSMIRANPGLILLDGSTIVGKWHFNSVPTFEDLNSEFKLKSGGPSFIQ